MTRADLRSWASSLRARLRLTLRRLTCSHGFVFEGREPSVIGARQRIRVRCLFCELERTSFDLK